MAGFEIEISLNEFGQDGTFDNSVMVKPFGFNITLRRVFGPYVYQCYFQCAAIVGICQISFIIPHESIPGRISLIATQFLTLTNIFIYQLSNSPSGTQLNALEIYILASLFFVLATIVEFGLVLSIRKIHLNGNRDNQVVTLKRRHILREKGCYVADKIDSVAFMIFPFAYIAFNCIYALQYSEFSF